MRPWPRSMRSPGAGGTAAAVPWPCGTRPPSRPDRSARRRTRTPGASPSAGRDTPPARAWESRGSGTRPATPARQSAAARTANRCGASLAESGRGPICGAGSDEDVRACPDGRDVRWMATFLVSPSVDPESCATGEVLYRTARRKSSLFWQGASTRVHDRSCVSPTASRPPRLRRLPKTAKERDGPIRILAFGRAFYALGQQHGGCAGHTRTKRGVSYVRWRIRFRMQADRSSQELCPRCRTPRLFASVCSFFVCRLTRKSSRLPHRRLPAGNPNQPARIRRSSDSRVWPSSVRIRPVPAGPQDGLPARGNLPAGSPKSDKRTSRIRRNIPAPTEP